MNLKVISNGFEKQAVLLLKKVKERILIEEKASDLVIELHVDAGLGAEESYLIEGKNKCWKITGTDEIGLYHGIGKFLHTSKWNETEFIPNPPIGLQEPDCTFRAMYYSVHFYNWYHMAPTEELKEYTEEMLLWGYNAIVCIIPLLNLNSCDEPAFFTAVEKVQEIFKMCKEIGMKVGIIINPNQGLKTTPAEFYADHSCYENGRGGDAGKNICPEVVGAMEYMKYLWVMMLKRFTDTPLDYVLTWPYDEGGCGCKECAPWGAKGYPKLVVETLKVAKSYYPNAKTIVSTWFFDDPVVEGEYEGFYQWLTGGLSDIDYIMVDAHKDFPKYPLEHEVIKPIVNFPEISMYGLFPWGGRGANPLLKRFQGFWDSSKHVLSGGMPYSEGKFEDISKIQFAGYYWDKDRRYQDIMAEYINYYYSGDVIKEVLEMMELIEHNHIYVRSAGAPDMEAAERSFELAKIVDAKLPDKTKKEWRWRILYIRSRLDLIINRYFMEKGKYEENAVVKLRSTEMTWLADNEEAQELMQELCATYHCVSENGENRYTRPPVKDGIVIQR